MVEAQHRVSTLKLVDSFAEQDLQLLPSQENLEKSDLPFDSWITGRSDDYRARHLIEDAPDLWVPTMLPEFVRSREQLIRQRLMALSR